MKRVHVGNVGSASAFGSWAGGDHFMWIKTASDERVLVGTVVDGDDRVSPSCQKRLLWRPMIELHP